MPAADRAQTASLVPGTHELTLFHDGRERSYRVFVPSALTPEPPLVIAYHGGGGNAAGFQRYADLDRVAQREGFLVVYPEGTGPLPRRLHTFNAGHCCGSAQDEEVDDVGFTFALLEDLRERLAFDAEQVFATGHSNGSMMAHRLAAEANGQVRAIAVFAGAPSMDVLPPTGFPGSRHARAQRRRSARAL